MDSDGSKPMRRDVTVWIAVGMVVVGWTCHAAFDVPQLLTGADPLRYHAILLTIFIGTGRLLALWFQTLIHGIMYARPENRVAVVMGHLFLGPIMAVGYYYGSRCEAKPRHVTAD
jgi:hypothetical protein